jgi:hypothetical protein
VEKKESGIRWQHISGKKDCGRTAIKRESSLLTA